MHDATQLAVKAAIIESRAIDLRHQAEAGPATALGKTALYHACDALIWAASVLTAEPVATIRARVNAAARDKVQLADYSPRRVTA
jgi:hypothetical protein